MAYTLSNLLRDAMKMQGIDAFDLRVATSGNATTMEDTTLEDKYGDDELKDGTMLVTRTSTGFPPQDEFARISAYSEGSQLVTFGALTTAIAASDVCMLISPEYPLQVLIEFANDALRDCGEVSGVDLTTLTIADAKEYALPVGCKRLLSIHYQNKLADTDDNSWLPLGNYDVIPSAANTNALIIFHEVFEAGHILKFTYNGFHPRVKLYSDSINEAIAPPLIALKLADKVMQWHGVTNENQNYANKILSELAVAEREYPVRKIKPSTQFFTFPKFS